MEKSKEVEGGAQKVRKGTKKEMNLSQPPPELFDSSWIEQYVLEMDVNPLTDALAQKIYVEPAKKGKTGTSIAGFAKKAQQ